MGILDAIFRLNSVLAMAALALISVAILLLASHALCISFTDKYLINPLAKLLVKESKGERGLLPRA
jgi:hypothetical protein